MNCIYVYNWVWLWDAVNYARRLDKTVYSMQLCNLLKPLTVDYIHLYLNIVFEVTFCQEENRVILRVQGL